MTQLFKDKLQVGFQIWNNIFHILPQDLLPLVSKGPAGWAYTIPCLRQCDKEMAHYSFAPRRMNVMLIFHRTANSDGPR